VGEPDSYKPCEALRSVTMEVEFVVYVNPTCPRVSIGTARHEPCARIHTTLCGEWTQGREECPGGYWLGPFDQERATHVALATGLPVFKCNLMLSFLRGEVRDRKPGYKAQDLHLLAVEGCRLRTVLRYPSAIDIVLEYPVIIGGRAYHLGDVFYFTVDETPDIAHNQPSRP